MVNFPSKPLIGKVGSKNQIDVFYLMGYRSLLPFGFLRQRVHGGKILDNGVQVNIKTDEFLPYSFIFSMAIKKLDFHKSQSS